MNNAQFNSARERNMIMNKKCRWAGGKSEAKATKTSNNGCSRETCGKAGPGKYGFNHPSVLMEEKHCTFTDLFQTHFLPICV